MKVIDVETGVTGYREVVDYVVRYGTKRSPRGLPTRDVGPLTVVIEDVSKSLPLGVGRNVSRKIAAAEAVQLIGGFSLPHLLTNASPNFKQFLEPDTQLFYGAYGDRVGTQLNSVVHKLMRDPDTRQAVITLWNPALDNAPGHLDYPCTVALHFSILDDYLELTTVMRSQDVWLGAPFDWFQFTQCQQTVARACGIAPGRYRHITLSTHIYETNLPAVARLTDPVSDEWQPEGIGHPGDAIITIKRRARNLVIPNPAITDWTPSERWYREQLETLMG